MAGGRKTVVGTRKANVTRPAFNLRRGNLRGVRQPERGDSIALEITGVEDIVAGQLRAGEDAATRAYTEIVLPWFRWINDEWPVRTGFSKSVLEVTARNVGDTLVMNIGNLAGYSFYIRQSWKATPNVAKRLLWDPSKGKSDRMLDIMAKVLGD